MTDLFTPMDLHGLALPNRIWMSAMTRTRATADNIPAPLMGEYYGQRATAGLIVTECTAVSEQGKGVINGPGLWREDQVKGWRDITEAVHNAKSRIFCQLWHCGRVAHQDNRIRRCLDSEFGRSSAATQKMSARNLRALALISAFAAEYELVEFT
jgi:N-ethylmaleimide reductase